MSTITYKGDIAPDGTVHPFRIAIRDGVSSDAMERFHTLPTIEVVHDPLRAQGMLIRHATKFLLREEVEKYQDLMCLVRVGVGTDNIDMQLASNAGIATMNTPGASTRAVAQRALAFMLTWAARTVQGTQALAHRKWSKGETSLEPIDLSEKTLGIIGYGRIGQILKKIAEPHFQRVIHFDVREHAEGIDLDTLLKEADVLSLHTSGTEEILTPKALLLLKATALIVNTSRGGVVNTKALLRRMDEGVSVALDVFPVEGPEMFQDPLIARLVTHPRFIGTPHTAASDPVTQRKLGREGAEHLEIFAMQGVVNAHDLQGHTLPRVAPTTPQYPGIRGILTHRDAPGVLARITESIRQQNIDVRTVIHEKGTVNGGIPLSMTIIDLVEERVETVLKMMDVLSKEIQPLKKRLLSYNSA